MKLSQLKSILPGLDKLEFQLPDGSFIPNHFHLTEIGQVKKKFIDCGGTLRTEKTITFQIWLAQDVEHRLSPEKFAAIIQLSEQQLQLEDSEIEVEYQDQTIGKYDLEFQEGYFILKNKQTACLAMDQCGIPDEQFQSLANSSNSCCQPGSGCC